MSYRANSEKNNYDENNRVRSVDTARAVITGEK